MTIVVRDGAGNLIREFSYGGTTGLDGGNAQSLTRSPDITGNFVQHTTVAGARKFSPGLKVDGTPFGNCPGHPATVTIAPASTSIGVGQTTPFTAQTFDQFGRAMFGGTITFMSGQHQQSRRSIRSPTNPANGIATGNVGAHNPGTVHITASATDGTTTANSTQATLTVTGPSLTINDVSVNEGNAGPTTFNFTVSLDPGQLGGVTFNIATQDGTATVANDDHVARRLTGQTITADQLDRTA